MRISFESMSRVKPVIACFIFLATAVTAVHAAPPSESMMMPKAERSLLLDIDRHGSKIVTVGERGHILISSDKGHSWVQSKVPVSQMLTAVEFINERQGWAVGHDGHIVHTDNGGKTWVKQRDGIKSQSAINLDTLRLAKERVKALKVKIAIGPSEQQLEQGVTPLATETVAEVDEYGYAIAPMSLEEQLEEAEWEVEEAQKQVGGIIVPPPLLDVWFADENNGWASGAFGTLVQTTDGGKTWADRSRDIGNDNKYHLNAIVGMGREKIIIGGEAGFLVYSHDGGVSWQQADFSYDGTIFGMTIAKDGSMIVATGLRGNTFKSIDNGVSWQTIYPGIDYSLSSGSLYGDGNLILVGTGGSISISHDSGESFQQYTLPARASLSSVVVLEDEKYLLVGQGGIHYFSTEKDGNVSTAAAQ